MFIKNFVCSEIDLSLTSLGFFGELPEHCFFTFYKLFFRECEKKSLFNPIGALIMGY